nr:hypothetical protein [Streptomyces pactum]
MTQVQLSNAEWEFIESYLPIGRFGPYQSRAVAAAVRGGDLAVQDRWAVAGDAG